MRQQMSTLLQRQQSGQQMRPQAQARLNQFSQTSPQNQMRVETQAFGQPSNPNYGQPMPRPMPFQGQQMQSMQQPMGGFQQQPGQFRPMQNQSFTGTQQQMLQGVQSPQLNRGQVADQALQSMGNFRGY